MKNLKTVVLFFASLFLFFSCANDFGEGSASVRIDPSIFSRDADGGEFSYVVAIMGETMEPVFSSGSSSSSLTLEFSELPVGERAFVYAKFSSNSPTAEVTYSGWSDDFIIKKGYQPVSLKLKRNDSTIPYSFFFDVSNGNFSPMADSSEAPLGTAGLNVSIYEESVNSYEIKRLTFTISSDNFSKIISMPCNVSDYWVNISLYCDASHSYTISDVRLDAFGTEYASGNFIHKVIKYPGSKTYRMGPWGFDSSSFISD
ncbi:MAG: hypothetical protein VZR56_08080 [Treponema sp.]|nr:hypothetical protein [Treponema sp.]